VDARQLSKGMGNIIRYTRFVISNISPELSDTESKSIICDKLQVFLDEKIIYAAQSIAIKIATSVIDEDDVILTFGSSPLVRKTLLHTAQQKSYRLIIVDTRPLHEGLQTLSTLSPYVKCVYCPLSGAALAMKEVKKVIVGASCLLSNGSMLATAGTALVAALAKSQQVPVLVVCETYKFSDKVQLDSMVFNELGSGEELIAEAMVGTGTNGSNYLPQRVVGYRGPADSMTNNTNNNHSHNQSSLHPTDTPQDMIVCPLPQSKSIFKKTAKQQQQQQQQNSSSSSSSSSTNLPFDVVNLRYDLTPLVNISVIVTEIGLIPPTSVPVLIREMQSDVAAEV
jgi:translation initiation factor 2B subunit (eIF-2B alpha/beta/delta family)